MEKILKQLSLALFALGLSAQAYADSAVLVPSQQGGFKLGIDALYLCASNSDLEFATEVRFPTGFTAGSQRNLSVDPGYEWGVYLQLGYLFACTSNDLTLSYTYAHNTGDERVLSPIDGFIVVNPLSPIINPIDGFGPVSFGAVEGNSSFNLNVLDLDAGQRFTTGSYDMRMFAGLRFAKIDYDLSTAVFPFPEDAVIGNTTIFAQQEFSGDYKGIGPRIGVESRYCIGGGFGLDANLNASFLWGKINNYYTASATNIALLLDTQFEAKDSSQNRGVPVLEGKLGFDYTYLMDCRGKSALMFEIGYQIANYFNAVEHTRSVGVDGFFNRDSASDIEFQGAYLGVKYYA